MFTLIAINEPLKVKKSGGASGGDNIPQDLVEGLAAATGFPEKRVRKALKNCVSQFIMLNMLNRITTQIELRNGFSVTWTNQTVMRKWLTSIKNHRMKIRDLEFTILTDLSHTWELALTVVIMCAISREMESGFTSTTLKLQKLQNLPLEKAICTSSERLIND